MDKRINHSPPVRVEVLLATLNGERYLSQFLDSLSRQKNVKIHLIVSDDGSTDKTLSIIQEYSNRFEQTTILAGPRNGPADNFMFLMSHSVEKFVAFADQDDVWLENHLFLSIQRLEDLKVPAMTFTQTVVFGDEISTQVWPKLQEFSLKDVLFQNYARGCTIVMNRDLCNLVLSKQPKLKIMHDWWVLLVGITCGEVVFCPSPFVLYRIHKNNHIGLGEKAYRSAMAQLKSGSWAPAAQLKELLELHSKDMHTKSLMQVRFINQSLNGTLMERLSWVFLHWEGYRSRRFDEFKLKIAIIIFPFITEKKHLR